MDNYNYEIKMVALDLDGTTFNSEGKLSDRTKETLEKAAAQGVHIVVSTGRAYTALPEQIKNVKGIEYAITSNGAHINYIQTGEQIYSQYVCPDVVQDVIRLKNKYDANLEIFIDGVAYMDANHYNYIKEHGCEHRNTEYVLWSRNPLPNLDDYLVNHPDMLENINLVFSSVEKLEKARPEVYALTNATIASSFKTNLEIGGPTTSKKSALAELLLRLNLGPENLMCCGDAPNDIQMIEFAGIGVAMGNAWGGTKDHADYVTATNDEDGVAQAIEKFVFK
ncbi:MAG: Cof-type HAD-IIB family hydrolase [Bacillota bacterium]|nr:Cof-type HAD-IIB family hydrolase [Bacillota bacterium]